MEMSRERSGDRRLRERSRTGTQSPRTTKRRSRERSSQRVRERLRTGTESPRMKRCRHDSEQSRSETSARSVTESSSHQASWSAA